MELPLLVALSTFLVVMLAGTAVFLYLNTQEVLQMWRRRAEGQTVATEEAAASGGFTALLQSQLRAVLE